MGQTQFPRPFQPTAHLDRGRWMLSSVQRTAGAYNLLIPAGAEKELYRRDAGYTPLDRSSSEGSTEQAANKPSLMDPSTGNAAGVSVAGAPAPARGAAAQPARAAPARSPLSARAAAAAALFVLGCASAALALLALSLNPTDAGFLGPCAPTGQAAANLRASSVLLLLAVAALALAATVAALVPARPFAPFACALGAVTAYAAVVILPRVITCQGQGRGHGAIAVYYGLFVAMLCAALLAAIVVAVAGDR